MAAGVIDGKIHVVGGLTGANRGQHMGDPTNVHEGSISRTGSPLRGVDDLFGHRGQSARNASSNTAHNRSTALFQENRAARARPRPIR